MFWHDLKMFLREALWLAVGLAIFYAIIITLCVSWRN